ncbi:hypothetical protein D3C85_1867220 [compost metagenome]
MEMIMVLTPTDLPEPVVPATSRCGILARFTTTGSPAMSWPRPMVKGLRLSRKSSQSRVSRR